MLSIQSHLNDKITLVNLIAKELEMYQQKFQLSDYSLAATKRDLDQT